MRIVTSALRLAATVILVRPSAEGPQVLLLRRSTQSAFMPGAFVFPGGAVDDVDYTLGQAPGWGDARIAAQPRDAHALVHAAVRELAEEASVAIEPAALTFFSHWITPVAIPRRFDTYFFIALAPPGAIGVADTVETHDAQWLTPREALDAHARGEMHMFFPTIKHLERLAAFDRIDALLAFAQEKPIVTIMPDGPPTADLALPLEIEGRW
jgi:8-oxo-dGTP pyrophosphatase MutT (NUDIX family)